MDDKKVELTEPLLENNGDKWTGLVEKFAVKEKDEQEQKRLGPYEVTWSKVYKPVFLLMADLWLFIFMFVLTLLIQTTRI